nr:hypothetical protein [Saprospiraceae bacterium]
GTGVAPFRSMLQDLEDRDQYRRSAHLIFGTRYEEGILYREEFELRSQSSSFRYDVALSREALWPGYKGYVHQIYETAYADVRPDVLFYVCGWSMMVDDATARLLDLGYDRKQVRFELYG